MGLHCLLQGNHGVKETPGRFTAPGVQIFNLGNVPAWHEGIIDGEADMASIDITGLGSVAELAKTVVNKFWPDKTEAEKQELAMALAVVQGQMDINKQEAAHPSLFVAGWRPFVGWVCGGGFAIQFMVAPLAEWGAALAGYPVKFPAMDVGLMLTLLGGMLGLSGMRSYDKTKGTAR